MYNDIKGDIYLKERGKVIFPCKGDTSLRYKE